jgi:hypothetical protein
VKGRIIDGLYKGKTKIDQRQLGMTKSMRNSGLQNESDRIEAPKILLLNEPTYFDERALCSSLAINRRTYPVTDLLLNSGATFSPCRRYRYALWRIWDESQPCVMWIGLNPSTADETLDDPTIRRCIAFAQTWGYGGIYMLNLFALRATQPRDMRKALDPVGPENLMHLTDYCEVAGLTVACWGCHGAFKDQDLAVSKVLGDDLWCLRLTKHGFPEHPLYVPGNVERGRFRVRRRTACS